MRKMRNVPIKFRAKDYFTGEYLFGDLIQDDEGVWVGRLEGSKYVLNEADPGSVAQLCGYDSEGNEIYEGDVLVHAVDKEKYIVLNASEYIAEIIPATFLKKHSCVRDFKKFELAEKELNNNDG